MKYLSWLLLFLSTNASALHLTYDKININTDKITRINGDINYSSLKEFEKQMRKTFMLPGPRIILIDSGGGSVEAGKVMIELLELEKSSGVKQACVVIRQASSMAFNLLTHCDVRFAAPDAHMLMHKVFLWRWPMDKKLTAKNLKEAAADLDKADEPYRQANSKALRITLRQYDKYAEAETVWEPQLLVKMHYLLGLVNLR